MNASVIKIVLLIAFTCVWTACSQASPHNEAKGNTVKSGSGHWDADLRNNEDASMGAKSSYGSPQPTMIVGTLDNTKAHVNAHLSMNRGLADQIKQAAHVDMAVVAVTNRNVYAAIDLGGMKEMGIGENEQLLTKNYDPASGSGLFGSGAGAGLDWISAKPLSVESDQAIRSLLTSVYPDANIFISTNPHFVSRMLFYDGLQRQSKRMDAYLNEFNTMAQYAFPSYSTGQNNLIHE